MAIQHRRGPYSQFDPTRLMPGEWAVVLTGDPATVGGKAVYMCFAAGDVKRMATFDDFSQLVEDSLAQMEGDLDDKAEQIEADLDAQLAQQEASISANVLAIANEAAQDARDAAQEALGYSWRIDYLEANTLEYESLRNDVDGLMSCCSMVMDSIAGLAHALAPVAGAWQWACEAIFAPSAERFTVSGTTGMTQGTVSGTTLALT